MKLCRSIVAVLVGVLLSLSTSWAQAPEMNADAAAQRVRDIVNQPVTHLPRTSEAAEFSPGWFHDGAEKPDFANADVRTTQQFPYSGSTYVTSDLNSAEMFVGSELEFNAATKYFYTDRSLPKKRLSDSEMVEINRLYRIIAQAEQAPSASAVASSPVEQESAPPIAAETQPQFGQLAMKVFVAFGILAVVGLMALFFRVGRS